MDVEADEVATLTVKVTDGIDTASGFAVVTVFHVEDEIDYVAYSASWLNADAANLSIAQGAVAIYDFDVELGSVEKDALTYTVELSGSDGADIPSFNVDAENNQVVIASTFNHLGDYTGVLTVTDGTTTVKLNFTLDVRWSFRSPFITNPRSVFLTEGETQTFDIVSANSSDPDSVVIDENSHFTVLEGDASKISFSYDNANKTYSLTALEGSTFETFNVLIYTTNSFEDLAGTVFMVYVKGASTAQELSLEEELILAQRYVTQSQELERLGDFLIDALEMTGTMSQEDAMENRLLLSDSRTFSETTSKETLGCMLSATQTGYVVNATYLSGYLDGEYTAQEGFICNLGETETKFADVNHYANDDNYAAALYNINHIKEVQENDFTIVNGQTTITIIENLTRQLKAAVPTFELGRVDLDPMLSLGNGLYSRFIGNSAYGSYDENSVWIWKPEYKVLQLVVAMANKTISF
ncbi:hypothetical protein CXF86_15370 [Shewanella sp. GutCb]|nr:hypothetical protein CXF86_15370 [Shewanella sp. GutCb]